MVDKVKGKVKWFSNKKGFGFLTPDPDSSVTEDVFVHQSSIFCEGYRTLVSVATQLRVITCVHKDLHRFALFGMHDLSFVVCNTPQSTYILHIFFPFLG